MEHLDVGATLAVEHAAGALAAALADAGVDVIVLKGPLQARALHGAVRRTPVDIDLLVAPPSLADAERVLAELGYMQAVETTGEDKPDHAHAWACSGAVPVDLHWSLAGTDPERLWGGTLVGNH